MIVLVGMPGCGKSTIGRLLARRLQLDFVDADQRIEQHLGCTIRSYFDSHGEEAFRDVEQNVLAELLAGGASDQEVLDALVRRYGERILAMPRTAGFGMLAWIVPPLALLAAALGIARYVRAARRARLAAADDGGEATVVLEAAPDLRARHDEELAALEGGARPFAVPGRAR